MTRARARWALVAAVVGLLFLILGSIWVWRQPELRRLFTDRAALEGYLDSLGAWGPPAIVAAEIVQVLFAFIPGQIVGLAAGYLYGAWWGGLLCLLGLAVGTVLATLTGRLLGRPLVERIVGAGALGRLAPFVERGRLALLLIFLVPFLPDDAVCFMAGLMPYSLPEMFILALVGRSPGVLTSTWIGAQAGHLSLVHLIWLSAIGLLLAVVAWRFQRPLEDAMFRAIERVSGWLHPRRR